jgi:signal transduction histidine kinase
MHSVLLTSLLDILFVAAAIVAIVYLWRNANAFRVAGAMRGIQLLTVGIAIWALYHFIDVAIMLGGPFVVPQPRVSEISGVFQERIRWFTDAAATAFLLTGFVALVQRLASFLTSLRSSTDALAHELTSRDTLEAELKTEARAEREYRRSKSEFLLGLSHELRTPLNGILGLASLLSNTDLDRDQRKLLGTLEQSAQTMLGRISDVLDLSLLENNRVELRSQPFQPSDIAQGVLALFEPLARAKGVSLSCDCSADDGIKVIGDPARIKQILTHLVSNALKFTSHGSVVIRSAFDPIDSEHVRITFSVTDTGIGMSPDLLAQVREGPALRTGTEAGVGLSICWRLARLMDGRLEFDSAPDQGTTVSVGLVVQTEPTDTDED